MRAGPFGGLARPRAPQRAPRERRAPGRGGLTQGGVCAASGEGLGAGSKPTREPRRCSSGCRSRAAGGGREGGDPAPPARLLGRELKALSISSGLPVPGVGVLGAGLATPRPGGLLREACATLLLGQRFLRSCRGGGGGGGEAGAGRPLGSPTSGSRGRRIQRKCFGEKEGVNWDLSGPVGVGEI